MQILRILLKAKFSFKIGTKVDLLIWTGWENKEIFNNLFKKINYDYIERPTDVINLPYLFVAIFLKIIKGQSIFINYFKAAVFFSKPKILLTTYDNYSVFYKFRKIFNVETGFIQNGHRFPYMNYLYNYNKKINYDKKNNHVNHMFVYGKNIQNELKKYINGKFYFIGSFRNNSISKPNNKISKDKSSIIFISQFRVQNSNTTPIPDGKILKLLDEYCLKKEIKLKIMCFCSPHIKRGRGKENFKEEINYYKNLKLRTNYKLLIRKNFYDSYRILQKENLIITENSALGYEMLALGKKVIFFPIRKDDFSPKGANHFGWPLNSGKSGPFWLNYYSPKKLFEKIEKIRLMNKLIWNDISKKYIKNIINFDYKNKILVQTIKKQINEYKKNS